MRFSAMHIGIVFLAMGICFGVIESTFYGHVDKTGVLQESFFLPLSVLGVIIGVLLLLLSGLQYLWNKTK